MTHQTSNKSLASEAKHTAKVRTDKAIADASETLAQAADPYAEAARNAADEFRSASPQAQGLNAVADQIDGLTAHLRGMDVNDIAAQARKAAQGNPLLFLGGAALVGFAAARMLKASDAPGRNPWAGQTASDVAQDRADYAAKVARHAAPTALGVPS